MYKCFITCFGMGGFFDVFGYSRVAYRPHCVWGTRCKCGQKRWATYDFISFIYVDWLINWLIGV